MKFISRTMVLAALVVGATAAHAALTYTINEATVTYNTGEIEDLANAQNGNSIDFFSNTSPMYVATVNTDRTSATVQIEYEVTSDDEAINALNLVFTGWAFGEGRVDYRELVRNENGDEIASTSGTLFGNTPFTQVDDLVFSESAMSYTVVKTFTLSLGNGPDGIQEGASFASIGLIEQNAVPEPATMAVMAVGALGVIARRRRNK